MSRVLAVVWLLGFALAAPGQAEEPFVYIDPVHHFRMTLPADWKEISRAALDRAAGLQSDQPGVGRRYHVGFQLRDRGEFEYPCILIQTSPANPTDLVTLRRSLAEANRIDNRTVTRKQLEQGKGFRVTEPELDAQRNSIWYFSDSNIDQHSVPGFKGIIVLFPGRHQAVQVNCFARATEWPQFSPTFQTSLESFAFDPGYEYVAPAIDWGGTVQSALLGVLLAVLVGVLWLRLRRPRPAA
ncbi:MAG: hypothetical protein JNM56_14575 [Planctomycetia bacterium]|nr:hypothetical protein [Planctomycetia bacterium]